LPALAGLPAQLTLLGRQTEQPTHLLLKLLAFLMLFRDRLQLEPPRPRDDLRFRPDLLELNDTGDPLLWVECGECSLAKLARLAPHVPGAEIWVFKASVGEARELRRRMAAAEIPTGRHRILGFERRAFREVLGELRPQNELCWLGQRRDPVGVEFELNGLWHHLGCQVWSH
jgi:hypothetical protein